MYGRRKLIGVTIDVDVQKWQDVVLLFFVSEIDVAADQREHLHQPSETAVEQQPNKRALALV